MNLRFAFFMIALAAAAAILYFHSTSLVLIGQVSAALGFGSALVLLLVRMAPVHRRAYQVWSMTVGFFGLALLVAGPLSPANFLWDMLATLMIVFASVFLGFLISGSLDYAKVSIWPGTIYTFCLLFAGAANVILAPVVWDWPDYVLALFTAAGTMIVLIPVGWMAYAYRSPVPQSTSMQSHSTSPKTLMSQRPCKYLGKATVIGKRG